MALRYKFNVYEVLCSNYVPSDLRELFGERDFQALKSGEMVSIESVNAICYLLGCQIGFLLEYCPDKSDEAFCSSRLH